MVNDGPLLSLLLRGGEKVSNLCALNVVIFQMQKVSVGFDISLGMKLARGKYTCSLLHSGTKRGPIFYFLVCETLHYMAFTTIMCRNRFLHAREQSFMDLQNAFLDAPELDILKGAAHIRQCEKSVISVTFFAGKNKM